MYIVKIGSRYFVCKRDNKFIVNNMPKCYKCGDVVTCSTWDLDLSVTPKFSDMRFTVHKLLRNKVITFKKKRRKAYTRTKNDNNHVAYLSING